MVRRGLSARQRPGADKDLHPLCAKTHRVGTRGLCCEPLSFARRTGKPSIQRESRFARPTGRPVTIHRFESAIQRLAFLRSIPTAIRSRVARRSIARPHDADSDRSRQSQTRRTLPNDRLDTRRRAPASAAWLERNLQRGVARELAGLKSTIASLPHAATRAPVMATRKNPSPRTNHRSTAGSGLVESLTFGRFFARTRA